MKMEELGHTIYRKLVGQEVSFDDLAKLIHEVGGYTSIESARSSRYNLLKAVDGVDMRYDIMWDDKAVYFRTPQELETLKDPEEEDDVSAAAGESAVRWGKGGFRSYVSTKHDNCTAGAPQNHKATAAFVIEEVTYHGGSGRMVEDEPFDGLVFNFSGYTPKSIFDGPKDWEKVLAPFLGHSQDVISLAWQDMGAPKFRVGFWRAVHEEAKRRGIKKVLFYCIGGHGRTGTALASILVEVSKKKPEEAVEYVRKNYCPDAVESGAQKDYLKSLSDSQQLKESLLWKEAPKQ